MARHGLSCSEKTTKESASARSPDASLLYLVLLLILPPSLAHLIARTADIVSASSPIKATKALVASISSVSLRSLYRRCPAQHKEDATVKLTSLPSRKDVDTKALCAARRAEMVSATFYADWKAAADAFDRLLGNHEWRESAESPHYNFALLRSRLAEMRRARAEGNVPELMFMLRSGLARNFGGLAEFRLYNVCHGGTKLLIHEYVAECVRAIEFIASADPHPSPQKQSAARNASWSQMKYDFLHSCKQAFGTTALVLDGGATIGIFHLGVSKALFEQNLLPRVISASAVGALVASVLCTHTDEELRSMFSGDRKKLLNISAFESVGQGGSFKRRLIRFFKHGHALDRKVLDACVQSNVGNLTFEEAYRRTGRVLNICVANTAFPPSFASGSSSPSSSSPSHSPLSFASPVCYSPSQCPSPSDTATRNSTLDYSSSQNAGQASPSLLTETSGSLYTTQELSHSSIPFKPIQTNEKGHRDNQGNQLKRDGGRSSMLFSELSPVHACTATPGSASADPQATRIFNYLTAPNVLVWSAACASTVAAFPLYGRDSLSSSVLAKDTNGTISYWSCCTWAAELGCGGARAGYPAVDEKEAAIINKCRSAFGGTGCVLDDDNCHVFALTSMTANSTSCSATTASTNAAMAAANAAAAVADRSTRPITRAALESRAEQFGTTCRVVTGSTASMERASDTVSNIIGFGSGAGDMRLAASFNVNHEIVSHAATHVFQLGMLRERAPMLGGITAAVILELRRRLSHLARLPFIPAFLAHILASRPDAPRPSLLAATSHASVSGTASAAAAAAASANTLHRAQGSGSTGGTVVITPELSPLDFLRSLRNPTSNDVAEWIQKGEKSTWPHITAIRARTSIEKALDNAIAKIK